MLGSIRKYTCKRSRLLTLGFLLTGILMPRGCSNIEGAYIIVLIRNSYPLIMFFRQSTFLFEKSRNTDRALRGGAVIQNVALTASAMDSILGSAAMVVASLLLGSQWSYFLMVIVDKF